MTFSMKQIFVSAMCISVAAFLITSLYIGEIAWLYMLDWIAWTIFGVTYLIYRNRYKKSLNQNHILSQIGQYEVPT